MIWLNYQDEGERARALVSMARGCKKLDARLAFLSSQDTCAATREAVARIEAAPLPHLSFRPVTFPARGPRNDRAWAGTIEVIRKELRATSGGVGPVVAWVESPLPRMGVTEVKTLRTYDEALAAQGTVATVISAFRLADVSARTLVAIVNSSSALVSAKMTVPCCPAWLISRVRRDLAPVPGLRSNSTVAPFVPTFQAEELAVLGQLAVGVVHELGNPLSIIGSSLQYLHQRLAAMGDPASDFTLTALQNVERMRGLLQGMLGSAGPRNPNFEHVDLKDAISEVLRFTSPECAQRSIAVAVSFDPLVPKAWIDPSGVKQIVLNLIKNALDAITQGESGNTLRIRTRMGPERTAVVEVENSGVPIPIEILPSLFRPFYTSKAGGMGLGLYLSRQIAREHGGKLVAENLPAGVQFTLTLPLDRRSDEEPWPTS
jgi:signal transduction histidine kinase